MKTLILATALVLIPTFSQAASKTVCTMNNQFRIEVLGTISQAAQILLVDSQDNKVVFQTEGMISTMTQSKKRFGKPEVYQKLIMATGAHVLGESADITLEFKDRAQINGRVHMQSSEIDARGPRILMDSAMQCQTVNESEAEVFPDGQQLM